MSSPVILVRQQIADTWEALTPPDRSAVTYHAVESRRKLTGDAGDRGFFLHLPRRGEPIAEAGITASQVPWTIAAELRLSQSGRSIDDLCDASTNESNLLARAIEKTSSWPANTIAVITHAVESTHDEESGDVIVTFEIEVQTSETD